MDKFKNWNNYSILVVDDSESIRKDVVKKLENFQFNRVLTAKNGQNAWDLIKTELECGHHLDLIISDINMPKMDGLTLLKNIRQYMETMDIPVIMLTTERESLTILTAISEGATNYIIKPVSLETLTRKLEEVLNKD